MLVKLNFLFKYAPLASRQIFVCLRLLICTITLCAPSPGAADPAIRVGVVIPLTGAFSSSGESIRNSILLASKQYDRNGNVQFLIEDDQMMPKNTVSAVTKLIQSNKVDALIVFGTPTSLAVNSIAESGKTPMIAFSILDQVVAGKNFVFKHWVTAGQVNELVTKGVKQRGYKRVAVFSSINDASLNLRDRFRTSGVADIVMDQEFNKEDLDFRAIIARLKVINPDAVYVLLWTPQLGVFVKQLRENGFLGDVFGYSNFEDPREVASSRGTLAGAWYVTGDDRKATAYYKEYESIYKTRPAAGGTNAYDVAKILIEGAESLNLVEYLRTLHDFSGTCGLYSATGHNDFDLPATTKIVTAKGFDFVEN